MSQAEQEHSAFESIEHELSQMSNDQERIRRKFPLVAQAAECVVRIGTRINNGLQNSHGSGVVLDGGAIATASHVIEENNGYFLIYPPNLFYTDFRGTVWTSSRASQEPVDLAVFPLPEIFEGLIGTLPIAKDVESYVHAFVIGYPRSSFILSPGNHKTPPPVIFEGLCFINDDERARILIPYKQRLNGISGGPVVNAQGEVLAITYGSVELHSQNYGQMVNAVHKTLLIDTLEWMQEERLLEQAND